jgi:hypothetical protein
MRGSLFDDIPVLSPEQAEKERNVEAKGFQYYRDCVLRTLYSLTFSEKFKIIKKVDSYIFLFLSSPTSRDPLLFGNGLGKLRSHYGRTTRQESAFVIQYFLRESVGNK